MRGEIDAPDENLLPSTATPNLFSKGERQSLPTAQSIPTDFMTTGANTAEMVPPPSITEPTTNLLNK